MKGDTEVLSFIAFFFAGSALGAALENATMEPYVTIILSALATLAAAFFGARYAFALQEGRQARETVLKHVTAANRLISALARTRNKFVAFRSQFINDNREKPHRYCNIQAVSSVSGFALDIDYDSLDFFLTSQDPNYIGRLSMVEQEVISTAELIAQRSNFHYHRLQPIVEAIEKATGSGATPQQIDHALEARDAKTLYDMTDQMIESVDGLIDSAERACSEANDIAKSLYPGHTILRIDYPNRGAPNGSEGKPG